jgi:hypothetical protein
LADNNNNNNNDKSDVLNKLSNALIQVSRGDPIIALRNEVWTRFTAINERFDAIDKATGLAHDDMVRVPTQVDKATGALRELLEQSIARQVGEIRGEFTKLAARTDERFIAVAAQFAERDTRTDQRASDTSKAVDAAFAANKEAMVEIKAGFTKQLDGIISNTNTKMTSLEGNIADQKDRLTIIESRTATMGTVRIDERATTGQIMTAVSLAFLGVSVLISVMAFILHR